MELIWIGFILILIYKHTVVSIGEVRKVPPAPKRLDMLNDPDKFNSEMDKWTYAIKDIAEDLKIDRGD